MYIKMPTPGSYNAGQTASTKLLLGNTHERVDIRCNAQIAAAPKDLAAADWTTVFGDIRVIANGQTKIEIDAADLVMRAGFYGTPIEAGVLPLDLRMHWMKDPRAAELGAYGTQGLSTLTIELDVKAGQTINSLEIYSQQAPQTPWGPHLEIHRYNRNVGVAGQIDISDLPRPSNVMMTAFHFNTSNINAMSVYADQVQRVDTDAIQRAAVLAAIGRTQAAGYTSWDYLYRDVPVDGQVMGVQDFRIKPTFTAAGSYNLITETIVTA